MGELRWKITKLQQDITNGNINVAIIAKDEADKQCKVLMKESDISHIQAFMKVYDGIYRNELGKIEGWVKMKQAAEVELFFFVK